MKAHGKSRLFFRHSGSGNVDEKEMFRVFNMGIGMIMIVPEKETQDIIDRLTVMGESAHLIGVIEKKEPKQDQVCFSKG